MTNDEQNLQDLNDELERLNQEAAIALADVKKGTDTPFDLHRWRDQKQKLEVQIPVVEARVLNQHIQSLKRERQAAKAKLDELIPDLETAAADYDEKLRALQESYERHAMIQVQCYNADQTIAQTWEELQEKKRMLRSLIKSVTGVDEEQQKLDRPMIDHRKRQQITD